MNVPKPVATLSLDLDNKWSYLKTNGQRRWELFPSFLDVVVPRVLSFFKERGLTVTIFIVGQDAALDKNHDVLKSLAVAGHEIGNHSFHHKQWLHLYSEWQVEEELAQAEQYIERATGQRPIGFRGPGFSISPTTLKVLARRGYLYDASTLPTYVGPLMKAYSFGRGSLSSDDKHLRQALFGTFWEGLRPLKPYR